MIHVIETFAVSGRNRAEFVALQEGRCWPALEARGAQPIGLWDVVLGGPRRLYMMTGYDSVGHWLECRDWGRDAGNADVGDAVAHLVDDSDAIAVRPITEARPGTAPEAKPGIYTVRTFRIDMKDLQHFIDLSENQWWPWVRQGEGVRPICQWTTVIAEQARILMMTRYDSLAHWEGHQLGNDRRTLDNPALKAIYDRALVAIRERSRIVLETSVKILRPLGQRRP